MTRAGEIPRNLVVRMLRPFGRRSIWCEACGLGNMQEALIRSLMLNAARKLNKAVVPVDIATASDADLSFMTANLDQIKNSIVLVSGIGCTSRLPGHIDAHTLHTTHGRALAFATGVKMARPDLMVVVVAGDGDIFAIGGNHFIHAARRNIDLTLIVYDNRTYGMTGGQHSPTSIPGEVGTSVPYGVFEPPFNLVELAVGASTSFVAQGAITTNPKHLKKMKELILAALGHRGFSFVNLVGTCHTEWGKRNALPDGFRYRRNLEGRVMPVERWRNLPVAQQAKYFPLGIIHQEARSDLLNSPAFRSVVAQAKREAAQERPAELVEVVLPAEDPLKEYPRTAVRFAGNGGMGVVTAGELALAIAASAGGDGTFTKNYGPEARGGAAYSEAIVSQGRVYFPEADLLDALVALTAESFEKFRDRVRPEGADPRGTIFVNSTVVNETYGDGRVLLSPLGDLYHRQVRPVQPALKELVMGVLSLAVAFRYLNLMPPEQIEAAVMASSAGKKAPAINKKALEVGFREADRLRGKG